MELTAAYDLVLECSDTFETKFLVNAACVETGTPLVWASVLAWEGQMSVMIPGQGPCYRCLFPDDLDLDAVPTARQVGILGAVAGMMGALEAVEAVKVLLGANVEPGVQFNSFLQNPFGIIKTPVGHVEITEIVVGLCLAKRSL